MDEAIPIDSIEEHGASFDDRFRLLADETRLAIMQALWEENDPLEPSPLSFTDLQEQAEVEDPGRLNYHLGELKPEFIRHTEEGYELREAGKRIMRIVISGTAIDEVEIEPTEIDISCVFCGGSTEISYEDGQISHRCLECPSRCVAEYPRGPLSQEELPPAGILNRTTGDIYPSYRVWHKYREASAKDGVCPACSGPMPVASIRTCEDHRPDPADEEICETCGSVFWGYRPPCMRNL